ncbi:MAG TPA: hypothetical protein PK024_09365 [Methanospirillum sp.]|uniref:hypothetical protein n=1 Tax=Methanospirillum sp. TaxID=45200 RepID=UPI002BD3B776|nr:hypothetical protein [Methanospirillum sp.]HOJ97027.1 hypothetical protein [Methanospirillum sp.]HOL40605.1 hypothetical protein [Methanospirillum sp.]HPP76786.1 hypothetical protein [Methanospirillum sp.]
MGCTGGGTTNRLILSGLLLAGSLGITLLFWALGYPFMFLFLFIPLIPFLGRVRQVFRCPVCGWETTGNERYCPYDGNRLELEE